MENWAAVSSRGHWWGLEEGEGGAEGSPFSPPSQTLYDSPWLCDAYLSLQWGPYNLRTQMPQAAMWFSLWRTSSLFWIDILNHGWTLDWLFWILTPIISFWVEWGLFFYTYGIWYWNHSYHHLGKVRTSKRWGCMVDPKRYSLLVCYNTKWVTLGVWLSTRDLPKMGHWGEKRILLS